MRPSGRNKELVEARDAIEAVLAKRKEEERAEIKRKIAELANESGFEVTELFGGNRGRKRTIPVPSIGTQGHFADVDRRGRKPNWLVEALGHGAKLESFEVR